MAFVANRVAIDKMQPSIPKGIEFNQQLKINY